MSIWGLLARRQMWAFAIGKLLTDPVWWFYLYWLGKFLKKNFGIKLEGLALPLVVIYLVADFGSIAGGWQSSALMRRGWSVNTGRKTAMLICALCRCLRFANLELVGRSWPHFSGGCRASGLVAQSVHNGVGYVSAPRRRKRCGFGRHGRGLGRHGGGAHRSSGARHQQQLCAGFARLRFRVSPRAWRDSFAGAHTARPQFRG